MLQQQGFGPNVGEHHHTHSHGHGHNFEKWQELESAGYPYLTSAGMHATSSDRSSFCSDSCSSTYSDYSEEEDSITRWPWITYIQDDGSLFFLEPYSEPLKQEANASAGPVAESTPTVTSNKNIPNKRPKGLGRIKGVIKRSVTFAKKDKDLAIDDVTSKDSQRKLTNNSTVGNKDALIVQENNNTELYQGSPKLSHNSYNSLESISYETTIVRKSIAIRLDKGVADNASTNLLEELLGIISGLDLDPIHPDPNHYSNKNGLLTSPTSIYIAIQGLIPNGPASRTQEIAIGDVLIAINGQEVSQRNVDSILSIVNAPCEVVLTIEKILPKPRLKSKILDLITGDIKDQNDLKAFRESCAVMYLTLDSDEDEPEGDILFWYPDSKSSSKLKEVRGMFLTIADLMDSVTGAPAKSSSLVIGESLVHVCYQKVGSNVLAIAVEAKTSSLYHLEQVTSEVKDYLSLLFGSVERAFDADNKDETTHVFTLLMERLLLGLPVKSQAEPSNLTADCLNGTRHLHLPSKKQVWISNTLSDAEAADYGECADDFFPHRRLYSTLGTCLFYKGHLVCNHLPSEDLKDFLLYCKYQCLLDMTEELRVNQLVVWKEVYPARRRNVSGGKECFEEPEGRWFLLVVGQKYSLLGVLLEAGGVASIPDGNPGPHPYYVDTALSILAYIQEALDFETICEAKLRGVSIPSLISTNDAVSPRKGHNNSSFEITKRKLPAHLESFGMRNNHAMDSFKTAGVTDSPKLNGSHMASPRSVDSRNDSTISEGSNSSGSLRKASYGGSISSQSIISSPRRGMGGDTSLLSTKLTAGIPNTLFYYTSFDSSKGVLICPSSCSSVDTIDKEILSNFHKSCCLIKQMFCKSSHGKQQPQVNGKTSNSSQSPLSKVLEQGILFQRKLAKYSDPKKSPPVLKYWVVGRKLGNGSREFYVCFQDGIPQNTVELAFRLGFGTVI